MVLLLKKVSFVGSGRRKGKTAAALGEDRRNLLLSVSACSAVVAVDLHWKKS